MTALCAAALLCITSTPARAGLVGSIFSGPTSADSAAIYWNPGAMPLLEGTQTMLFGAVSAVRLEYDRDTPAPDGSMYPLAEVFVAKPAAFVGVVTDLGFLEDLRIGLGATIPILDGARWSDTFDDQPSSTRYFAVNARQLLFTITPAVAYRVNRYFSIGFGLDIVGMILHHEAMVDFGGKINQMGCSLLGGPCSLGNPFRLEDATYDARAIIDGMGWGVGASIGVLLTPAPWLRLGLGFHSGAGSMTIPVEMTVELPDSVKQYMAANLSSVSLPEIVAEGKVKTTSPWAVMAGASFHPTETVELAVDLHWMQQSATSTMVADVVYSSSTLVGDQVLVKQREDVFLVGLRGSYRFLRPLAAALRVEYENNTRPEESTSPVSIDFHKISLHLGLAWQATSWLAFSLEYAHYFLLTRTVANSQFHPRAEPLTPVEQGFDKPSPTGTYTGRADRVGLGIALDF